MKLLVSGREERNREGEPPNYRRRGARRGRSLVRPRNVRRSTPRLAAARPSDNATAIAWRRLVIVFPRGSRRRPRAKTRSTRRTWSRSIRSAIGTGLDGLEVPPQEQLIDRSHAATVGATEHPTTGSVVRPEGGIGLPERFHLVAAFPTAREDDHATGKAIPSGHFPRAASTP